MRLLAIPALLAAAPAAAAAAAAPAEVPVRMILLSDGTPRWSVPVTIDGRTVDAMVDTGSFGLRVLALGSAGAGAGAEQRYSYSSGVELAGPAREAQVTIGGRAARVPVQFVARVGCRADRPDCPASRIAPADYRIGGDGLAGEGFVAILGVSLPQAGGRPSVPNPLTVLARRWTLALPQASDAAGRLVLDPAGTDAAGYTMFPLDPAMRGRGGGLNDALPACLALAAETRCGPLVIDSGAVGVSIGGFGGPAQRFRGPATLTVGPLRLGFEAGRDPLHRVALLDGAPAGAPIYSGALVFAHATLLYDDERHAIGLRPFLPVP